jgi:hypothetical protein
MYTLFSSLFLGIISTCTNRHCVEPVKSEDINSSAITCVMFVVYLHIKFHMPSIAGSVVIAARYKVKQNSYGYYVLL